ncbi:MAG TPA: hypothetical protein VID27_20245, partial [Blastocatellia bacterium]
SFTEFKGRGFWSRDDFLEEWLRQLAAECRKQTSIHQWLVAACEHWGLQATGTFNGWIHANLDEFLVDAERLSLIISISESLKNMFPANHHMNKTGDLFIRLLKVELTTDASSPLDYMVSSSKASTQEKI